MVKSKLRIDRASGIKRLASMGETSKGIINELYNPIDAANRFINLALQSIDENSQGRQFLLESKEGMRKTSMLLNKLHQHARKMEQEIQDIAKTDEQTSDTYIK